MSILGQAIARHLVGLRGLYSVELPEQILNEAFVLVNEANLHTPKRALFVTDDSATSGVELISWRELLGWRTEDDRIFVWKRGIREPDTSFRSVVLPFISNRFPSTNESECSLDLFVELSIKELWLKRGIQPVGDSYDAFVTTARWVAGVLRIMFEDAGSLSGFHWSDRFIAHWAQMLDTLDASWTAFNGPVIPRHAWELVRLSGLPLPSPIVNGNPFLGAPLELEQKEWKDVAKIWSDVVRSFIIPDGAIAIFLTALDRQASGAAGVSPWRQLDWGVVSALSTDSPAPTVGFAVFSTGASPSLFHTDIPRYPVAPTPSWWGVSTGELDEARKYLRSQTPLRPDNGCAGLLRLKTSDPTPYVLNTRGIGSISYAPTAKKWRARVTVTGINLKFREDWRNLHVCSIAPTAAGEGDAWIDPDKVQIEIKGAEIETLTASSGAGDMLHIQFGIKIEYAAARNETTGELSGKWKSERKIRAQLHVCRSINGIWDVGRNVSEEIELIIPSPFSPTVLVYADARLEGCVPANHDDFNANFSQPNPWAPSETPTIVLDEEGSYTIQVYDGVLVPSLPQFADISQPTIAAQTIAGLPSGMFSPMQVDIDDGLLVQNSVTGTEIVAFKVKERSGNLSSGLLSAVRGMPAGRKQPSGEARNSIQGQYQDSVGNALAVQVIQGQKLPNSLYQYVISSSSAPVEWRQHSGTPAAELLINAPSGFMLPGIGNGPSAQLTQSTEWHNFMQSLAAICAALGIRSQAAVWLSGLDFSSIPTIAVTNYISSHVALVRRAKQLQPSDSFWASYPFSIIVVDGRMGINFGQMLSVMLSPLHPARLAWAFSVSKVARDSSRLADPALLSLAEGWNIPCSGSTLNAAQQTRHLVAVPTNPGSEQDFLAWSALAVLGDNGIADLPIIAAGQSLPWGGRTGINTLVVERAIDDYLLVHPHVNSFQLDIRSVSPTPRAQEIDEAVLKLVGGCASERVAQLNGGIRVWDSEDRQGLGPTRDALFAVRNDAERDRQFEWRTYAPDSPPSAADLALIENANVHLAVVTGTSQGVIGLLPLRRFSPAFIQNHTLDQNFSPLPGEDLLGLSYLLREIESTDPQVTSAIRATPQVHALGLAGKSNWEVLGTFNLDPAVLSSLVATASQTGSNRLLWEWRPSWMPVERKLADLARRPYFVVAKVPASLLKALENRQGLTPERAMYLLASLGLRGIGLSALNAQAGTGESAAAGFFYAFQLLMPASGINHLTGAAANSFPLLCVVPIDPLVGLLQGLAFRPLTRRADILAIGISRTSEGVKLCFVPVEVKHHGMQSSPATLPLSSDPELARARQQLAETSKLLTEIATALSSQTTTGAPQANYLRRLGLATLLDLALSFFSVPMAPSDRAEILHAVLTGSLQIGIGDSILLRFAPGSLASTGAPCLVDPFGQTTMDGVKIREIFIDPTPLPALWWQNTQVGADEPIVSAQVVDVLRSAFATCGDGPVNTAADVAASLRVSLGLETAVPAESPSQQSTEPTSQPPSPDSLPAQDIPERNLAVEPSNQGVITQPSSPTAPPPPEDHSTQPPAVVNPVENTALQTIIPRAFVGWSSPSDRWSSIGKIHASNETVALDLDHPKTIGIFGYMGSGKSYLLGNLIESAAQQIPGINQLSFPLAVVVFNYRRNAADRFELSSLAIPNSNETDVEKLRTSYQAAPAAIRDIHVLCLPGELRPERQAEYGHLPATELFFDPRTLGAEDWELLMGEPGSEAVFARTIRNTLVDLRSAGAISLDRLEQQTTARLSGQSRTAAALRFDFIRRYISEDRGCNFAQLLRPGRVLVVDLRQPLFNKEDALRFFLVCANQISGVQSAFNKLIVFDEAHEYLSDAFGERMESRIRLMRHEGTSYVFATQDVRSIPTQISRFLTTRFVFDLGTRENVEDLERIAPDFRNYQVLGIRPGRCFLQSTVSTQNLFSRPREVEIRPRVTQHGGQSRIFSNPPGASQG